MRLFKNKGEDPLKEGALFETYIFTVGRFKAVYLLQFFFVFVVLFFVVFLLSFMSYNSLSQCLGGLLSVTTHLRNEIYFFFEIY